jgi:hypothetical protein
MKSYSGVIVDKNGFLEFEFKTKPANTAEDGEHQAKLILAAWINANPDSGPYFYALEGYENEWY